LPIACSRSGRWASPSAIRRTPGLRITGIRDRGPCALVVGPGRPEWEAVAWAGRPLPPWAVSGEGSLHVPGLRGRPSRCDRRDIRRRRSGRSTSRRLHVVRSARRRLRSGPSLGQHVEARDLESRAVVHPPLRRQCSFGAAASSRAEPLHPRTDELSHTQGTSR
jgi:hypothetical protein